MAPSELPDVALVADVGVSFLDDDRALSHPFFFLFGRFGFLKAAPVVSHPVQGHGDVPARIDKGVEDRGRRLYAMGEGFAGNLVQTA